MPTFHIYIDCATATGRPGGTFDTFVHVSDDAMIAGAHLRLACRRAAIIGFGGPHRIVEARRLDPPSLDRDSVDNARPALEARLRAALREPLLTAAASTGAKALPGSCTARTKRRGPRPKAP